MTTSRSYLLCPAGSAAPSVNFTTEAAVADPARWDTSTPSMDRIGCPTGTPTMSATAADAAASRAARRAASAALALASKASAAGRPVGRSDP